MKTKNLLLVLMMGMTLIYSGCNTDSAQQAANDAFNPGVYIPQVPPELCYADTYSTPEDAITRKMDVLILIDTSGSIVDERAAIATGFDNFINILPSNVDFQAAVMLAHGPSSSRSGVLYKKGTEPLILDNTTLTVEEIKTHLRTKMQNPATDNSTDGGEMGLFSLMKGLTTNLDTIRNQGFLRDDAALVVVFVADEQDICAEFPAGIIPVVDGQNIEPVAKANYCYDGNGVNKYLPETVVAKLREVQNGLPLVVGGVLYNNVNTIQWINENEIGYGYLETVLEAGGINVDMATGDYSNGLQNLGTLATSSIMPQNEFNLSISNVDPDSIRIKVDNVLVPYIYMAELNQVHLVNARDILSTVEVSYCEKPAVALESIHIANGGNHSCSILASGDVKCWGANTSGQLGLGHTINVNLPSAAGIVDLGGVKAVQLTAGLSHTCALLENSQVKCWGSNTFGQLGYGDTIINPMITSPASVGYVSLGENAKKIFAGTNYNCAILASNNVRCWGDNQYGQLGQGHINNIGDDEVPSSVPVIPFGAQVVQLDLSTISSHSCALLTNGNLKCWGSNSNGQLGYGTSGASNNIGDDPNEMSMLGAVNVGGNVTSIATGNSHTCVLIGAGNVKCWGLNGVGQLGYGNTTNLSAPSVDFVNLGEPVIQLTTGNNHNCALLASNNVVCWGEGSAGQLGYGNNSRIGDTELPYTAGYVDLGFVPSMLASGANHNCALEKDTGKNKCWGSNSAGQLGRGNSGSGTNIGDNELPSSIEFISVVP
ncbi:MAG: hypothetical protein JNM93_00105 [Bacteriovoracaceae bacterium]|nr:hypothetical protein [Bacteriovoracaceae bacterium]